MLKDVLLSDISMFRNYRDVEPPTEKDPDVLELAGSIKKHGVMQAVLLREDPAKKGKYQLVFGHRRLMAAKVAGLSAIPSSIKEVADDDILELQVTENLQRKDVHPMDEAIAFKSLIDKKKYTVPDLAAKFAKKEDYVVHRLKFNDLIPDLQAAFKKGYFLAGHALLLARLTPEDQKEVYKERSDFTSGDKRDFGSVYQLQEYIAENIVRDLSKAPFNKEDAKLFAQAGACTTCTKRSGCGNLLFADLKEDDRCFDKACFSQKQEAYYLQQVAEIIETKPEIKFVADRHRPIPQAINKLLQQHKIKLLKEHNEYSEYNYNSNMKVQAKGFYINGYYQGQTKTIYLPGKAKESTSKVKVGAKTEMTAAEKKEIISGINQREKRAKELDVVKIHRTTIEKLDKIKSTAFTKKHQPIDRGIMIFLLLQSAGYKVMDKFAKEKEWPKPGKTKHHFDPEYFQKLAKISDDQLAFLIRHIAWDKYGNRNLIYGIDTEDTAIRIIAGYAGIDLKKIDDEQAAAATARQARVKTRLAQLSDDNKEKKSTASPKKKALKKNAK